MRRKTYYSVVQITEYKFTSNFLNAMVDEHTTEYSTVIPENTQLILSQGTYDFINVDVMIPTETIQNST